MADEIIDLARLMLTVEERTQKSDVDMLDVRILTTRLRNQTNELKNRNDVWKDMILLCNELEQLLEQLIGNRNRQQKMFSGIIEHLDARFWTALETASKKCLTEFIEHLEHLE